MEFLSSLWDRVVSEKVGQVECTFRPFELNHGGLRALGKREHSRRGRRSLGNKRQFQDKLPEFCSIIWITNFPLSIEMVSLWSWWGGADARAGVWSGQTLQYVTGLWSKGHLLFSAGRVNSPVSVEIVSYSEVSLHSHQNYCFIFILFWDRVSFSIGWSRTLYVASPEFLNTLLSCDYRHHTWLMLCWGASPGLAFCILSKHSTNWAKSPIKITTLDSSFSPQTLSSSGA